MYVRKKTFLYYTLYSVYTVYSNIFYTLEGTQEYINVLYSLYKKYLVYSLHSTLYTRIYSKQYIYSTTAQCTDY